jgi:hypothetical protein
MIRSFGKALSSMFSCVVTQSLLLHVLTLDHTSKLCLNAVSHRVVDGWKSALVKVSL